MELRDKIYDVLKTAGWLELPSGNFKHDNNVIEYLYLIDEDNMFTYYPSMKHVKPEYYAVDMIITDHGVNKIIGAKKLLKIAIDILKPKYKFDSNFIQPTYDIYKIDIDSEFDNTTINKNCEVIDDIQTYISTIKSRLVFRKKNRLSITNVIGSGSYGNVYLLDNDLILKEDKNSLVFEENLFDKRTDEDNPNAIIYLNQSITEYLVQNILALLYRDKISIHYFCNYSLFLGSHRTIVKEHAFRFYSLLPVFAGSAASLLSKVEMYRDYNINYVFFSMLHIILTIQKNYKAMHCDVKLHNILLEDINKSKWFEENREEGNSETTREQVHLTNYDEVVLDFGVKKLHFLTRRLYYTPKLADFGLSSIFREDIQLINDITQESKETAEYYPPNYYSDSYDIRIMISSFLHKYPDFITKEISDFICWYYSVNNLENAKEINDDYIYESGTEAENHNLILNTDEFDGIDVLDYISELESINIYPESCLTIAKL